MKPKMKPSMKPKWNPHERLKYQTIQTVANTMQMRGWSAKMLQVPCIKWKTNISKCNKYHVKCKVTIPTCSNTMQNDRFYFQTVAYTRQMFLGKKTSPQKSKAILSWDEMAMERERFWTRWIIQPLYYSTNPQKTYQTQWPSLLVTEGAIF